VKQGGIEKQAITFLKGKLYHHLVKHIFEGRVSVGYVAIIEVLGVGEELSWAGVKRHIGVSDGALKSQELRGYLRDDWESRCGIFGLEAEVSLLA
jgi:hypothetical protein